MDEHNEENRFECGLSEIYGLSKETSCKDNIYPKIKNNNKSCRSRRIKAAKIMHMNNMAHEEKNCHPRSRD
jgi:hypothetical protein